jgi:hypothetical protein
MKIVQKTLLLMVVALTFFSQNVFAEKVDFKALFILSSIDYQVDRINGFADEARNNPVMSFDDVANALEDCLASVDRATASKLKAFIYKTDNTDRYCRSIKLAHSIYRGWSDAAVFVGDMMAEWFETYKAEKAEAYKLYMQRQRALEEEAARFAAERAAEAAEYMRNEAARYSLGQESGISHRAILAQSGWDTEHWTVTDSSW